MRTTIEIRGAREHNLKNISLEIPRDQLVVVTGVKSRSARKTRSWRCCWRCPLEPSSSYAPPSFRSTARIWSFFSPRYASADLLTSLLTGLLAGFGCPEHVLAMGDIRSDLFMFNNPTSARLCPAGTAT